MRAASSGHTPWVCLLAAEASRLMPVLKEAGLRFHLIYCDPPFATGRDRTADAGAFADRWPSLAAYVDWMAAMMAAMRELLLPAGFFCLHADFHAAHYLKVAGDAVFGGSHFRNEIIWHYTGRRQPARGRVNRKHDNLFVWARSAKAVMQPVFEPWDRDRYVRMKRQAVHRDEHGREWIWGHRGRGRSHAYRIYLDEAVARGRAVDSVWDIPIINTSAGERTGYPTQKPEALLTRLVALLTPGPGAVVGDFMAGSGTTAAAALRLGRSAVVADVSPQAVAVMERRLAALAGVLRFERRRLPLAAGGHQEGAQPEASQGPQEAPVGR